MTIFVIKFYKLRYIRNLEVHMIGTKIRQLRKEQSMSLKDLSEKVDVSVSFLSDIENNRSKPSLERVQDIAKGLHTSVSYLLDEDTSGNIEIISTDKMFNDVLQILEDFPDWSADEKDELLLYLRIKKLIRDNTDIV